MTSHESPDSEHTISTGRLVGLGIAARLPIDMSVQIFGPFLQVIAGGLGISIVTLGAMNSARNLMGILAPAVGVWAERVGYRKAMRWTLRLGGIGLLLFGSGHLLALNLLGLLLVGFGLFSFVPIYQAYLSAHVPYNYRARMLGIVEYSWALAGIFGLSVSGWLIGQYGWRVPFLILGVLILVISIFFNLVPPTVTRAATPWSASDLRQLRQHITTFLHFESNRRSSWSAILAVALTVFATSHIGITYGAWLTRDYGLSAVELGQAAIFFGSAELVGSILVSIFADRFGKRRTVLFALVGSVIGYALLPWFNASLPMIIVGLVWVRFTFEVSMVSNISMLSEQQPAYRAKLLSIMSAAVTLSSAISSLTGPLSYSIFGVWGLAVPSTLAVATALVITLKYVRERS